MNKPECVEEVSSEIFDTCLKGLMNTCECGDQDENKRPVQHVCKCQLHKEQTERFLRNLISELNQLQVESGVKNSKVSEIIRRAQEELWRSEGDDLK